MKVKWLAQSTFSVYGGNAHDLEGFQIAVGRPYPGFFPFGDFGYGQSAGAGLDCPNDPPLQA
jgi:hypothetical protein